MEKETLLALTEEIYNLKINQKSLMNDMKEVKENVLKILNILEKQSTPKENEILKRKPVFEKLPAGFEKALNTTLHKNTVKLQESLHQQGIPQLRGKVVIPQRPQSIQEDTAYLSTYHDTDTHETSKLQHLDTSHPSTSQQADSLDPTSAPSTDTSYLNTSQDINTSLDGDSHTASTPLHGNISTSSTSTQRQTSKTSKYHHKQRHETSGRKITSQRKTTSKRPASVLRSSKRPEQFLSQDNWCRPRFRSTSNAHPSVERSLTDCESVEGRVEPTSTNAKTISTLSPVRPKVFFLVKKGQGDKQSLVVLPQANCIKFRHQSKIRYFQCDAIYKDSNVKDLVVALVEPLRELQAGTNVCAMVMGHSRTGKTNLVLGNDHKQPGFLTSAIKHITRNFKYRLSIQVSAFELYGAFAKDLLKMNAEPHNVDQFVTTGGTQLVNMSMKSDQDIHQLLKRLWLERRTLPEDCHSSGSHLVVRVVVANDLVPSITGTLHIVDMAGFRADVEKQKPRLMENQRYINITYNALYQTLNGRRPCQPQPLLQLLWPTVLICCIKQEETEKAANYIALTQLCRQVHPSD